MIESILSERIFREPSGESPLIVAICGAADLGKSHLSKRIIKQLEKKDIRSSHLTLDSFMMDRNKRLEQGLSGYHIEAYDLERAKDALSNFKQQNIFCYSPYDHSSGINSSILKTIENCSVLIFDGLHSMHQEFSSYIDISIFIYTEDAQLRKMRSEADTSKRGQTKEFSQSNSSSELRSYKMFVEPYVLSSTLKLYMTKKWSYELQE